MTYRELAKRINQELTQEQLDARVTIQGEFGLEFKEVKALKENLDSATLHPGHPVLTLKN